MPIRSFRCADTDRLFRSRTEPVALGSVQQRWGPVLEAALRKLILLDAADVLTDLPTPPDMPLRRDGDRWHLPLVDPFELRFEWREGGAIEVEIVGTASCGPYPSSESPQRMAHPTPGEILQREFLSPRHLSQRELARFAHIGGVRLNRILDGRAAIRARDADGLAATLRTSVTFWRRLQEAYERATRVPARVMPKPVRSRLLDELF